jgi:hypothetical protein
LADGEPLGCLLIGGAAKTIHDRDRWIGWDVAHRRHNLSWVINNSRYLIFPWVQIPHLASHALGQLARRVAQDWEARWGYRPVLMETFVDPRQHTGICYQAAGWEMLGETCGKGITRPGKYYTQWHSLKNKTTKKYLFRSQIIVINKIYEITNL